MSAEGSAADSYDSQAGRGPYGDGKTYPAAADAPAASRSEVVVIGEYDPERQRIAHLCDDLAGAFIVAMAEHSTEDLLAMADYRDSVRLDGWMQRVIREYVEVWR